jgi:thiamine biosynthesis lipoprotein
MLRKKTFAFWTLTILLLVGCSKVKKNTPAPLWQSKFIMDTMVSITYYDPSAGDIIEDAFTEIRRIEDLMSSHKPTSEIGKINSAPAQTPVKVSKETFELIEKSLYYSRVTDGAFDITIGPILRLWDILNGKEKIPSHGDIAAALDLVGYQFVTLDEKNTTVSLEKPNMSLDLGGVAKGYAIDRAREIILKGGLKSAVIDAGGDVWAIGSKPDGGRYNIGVRHPRDLQELLTVVPIRDKSIVTSGDYQRYFVKDGVRYHHIFDPHVGKPANSGLISVTLIGPDGAEGDILATAVFVLGKEKGLELLESLPDVAGMLITEDLEVVYGPGWPDD